MSSSFPGALDDFPTAVDLSNDNLDTKPHSTLHGDLGEAVEFLSDIEPLQLQHNFRFDAITIDRGKQLGDSLVQARTHSRLDLGQPRAHLGHERHDAGATLLDEVREPLALAQAHRTELVERLLEYGATGA